MITSVVSLAPTTPLVKCQTTQPQATISVKPTVSDVFHHLNHDYNFGGFKLDAHMPTRAMEQDEQPQSSNYCNVPQSQSAMNTTATNVPAEVIIEDDNQHQHVSGRESALQDVVVGDTIEENPIEEVDEEEDMDASDAVRDIVDELQQQHQHLIQLQQQHQHQQQHQLQPVELDDNFQRQQELSQINEYVGEVYIWYYNYIIYIVTYCMLL